MAAQIFGTDARIVIGAGIALGLVAIYAGKRAGEAAGEALGGLVGAAGELAGKVGEALNPASQNNLVYRGVNGAGEVISGDQGWSLGVWAWEALNPGQAARDNAITAPTNLNPNRNGGGASGGW